MKGLQVYVYTTDRFRRGSCGGITQIADELVLLGEGVPAKTAAKPQRAVYLAVRNGRQIAIPADQDNPDAYHFGGAFIWGKDIPGGLPIPVYDHVAA